VQVASTPARWISFYFLTVRSLRGHKFLFFYRAQPARWKSCFTSAAQQLPELVLLTVPNIRQYFYTKIRFSTPAHVGLRVFCAYRKKCRVNLGSKSSGWLNKCTCLNTSATTHARP
jgi:hypothetical protein